MQQIATGLERAAKSCGPVRALDGVTLELHPGQVLGLAGEGKTSAAIAAELRLSDGTVRNYLSEAISKLRASNRVEAARIAREKGWI